MKNLTLLIMGFLAIFTASSFKSISKNAPAKKKILIIGIDPKLIDFTSPEYAAFPGLTAEKVEAGVKASQARLAELGYETDLCWVDFGATAVTVIDGKLKSKKFDGVLIGAGIRIPPTNFTLFEQVINIVHEKAAKAKIFFNTNPKDTVEAVQRWIKI